MAKKAGFVWRNRDLNDMQTNIQKALEGQERAVEQILEDIGEQAAEKMQNLIATTPSGIVPGKPDRILTGTMHDAVGSKPVTKKGNYRGVEFGWTEEQIKYFIWQEQGTGSPLNIVPMHALLQTFLEAREELRDRLNQEFK